MAFFQVKVVNKSGKIEEFNKEYPNISALKNDLAQKGLLLVEVKEKKKQKQVISKFINRLRSLAASGNLGDEDVYNLFFELGIILKAGVPVMKAFHMIIEETGKESIRKFLEQILFKLKEGRNFSDILEETKGVYDFKPYIPVIRMGEKTGQLGESFLNIASSIENWIKIRSEITNAMIYPVVLLGTSMMAVYVMLVYVIPKFQAVVKGFKVVLPFHTRMLFTFSNFLNNNQDLVLVGGVALMLGLLILGRQPSVKEFFHGLLYRMPVIKTFKFSSENLHFLHSFSNLLSGGVPILTSLDLSLESFTSPRIREKLKRSVQSLRKGDPLANALKETDIFPEIVPNMVRVGEESGTLPEVLKELYHFMSERFLKKIKKYMNLMEPLIIVFVAVFIGMIIMTILPIIINISDVNF